MRFLLSGIMFIVLTLSLALAYQGTNADAEETQSARGAALYHLRCSVCHGATGQGLAEARLAFPEDHRRCSRCHKEGNPVLMANPFIDNNMFDIGDAPALVGEDKMAAFPNAAVLQSYIRAEMPRHAPGSLADAEYWDITAHLLALNRALPAGTTLTEQNAVTLPLP